jgi:hypothetical protein
MATGAAPLKKNPFLGRFLFRIGLPFGFRGGLGLLRSLGCGFQIDTRPDLFLHYYQIQRQTAELALLNRFH